MAASFLGNRFRDTFRVGSLAATGFIALGLLTVSGAAPATAAPALNAYVSQPYVQGPDVAGVQLETFDTECPSTWWSGLSNPGTMTGDCTSMDGDIWGGASSTTGAPSMGDGTAQSKYGAVFVGNSITVTLDHPASYLGFHWEAGDSGNFITLLSGGVEVATFTTEDLMNMLYYDAMGSWSANDYLINPARSEWIGAPFAYIHLVGVGGLTFDSFTMTEPFNGGFEFDNFAIQDNPVTLDPDTVVSIGDETPPDANGNGVDDTREDSDGDGIIDPFEDSDGDGASDVFEDSDGDGTSDYAERVMLADTGVVHWPLVSAGTFFLGLGFSLVMLRRRLPAR